MCQHQLNSLFKTSKIVFEALIYSSEGLIFWRPSICLLSSWFLKFWFPLHFFRVASLLDIVWNAKFQFDCNSFYSWHIAWYNANDCITDALIKDFISEEAWPVEWIYLMRIEEESCSEEMRIYVNARFERQVKDSLLGVFHFHLKQFIKYLFNSSRKIM